VVDLTGLGVEDAAVADVVRAKRQVLRRSRLALRFGRTPPRSSRNAP
jgi:hypothetical protein